MKNLITFILLLSVMVVNGQSQYDDIKYTNSTASVINLPPSGYTYFTLVNGVLYSLQYQQLTEYNTFQATTCTSAETGLQTTCYIASNIRKQQQTPVQNTYGQTQQPKADQGRTTIIKKNITNYYGANVGNQPSGNYLNNQHYLQQGNRIFIPGKGFVNPLEAEYLYNAGYKPYNYFRNLIWR